MTDADEKFFAWLDGELAGEEAIEMERRVAANAELSRLAAQHRAMQSRLSQTFETVAQASVPQKLRAAVRPNGTQVVDLDSARRDRRLRRWGSLPQWAAIAATLVVGVLIGTIVPQRGGAPVEVRDGRLYAAASLDRALTDQLASSPGGNIRIGLSFRDRSGAICRSFTAPQASGLACRNGGRWNVRGLFAAPEGQTGEYRMAGGMDSNLATLVDSTMVGEPFGAAEEKAAKQRGWR